VKFFAFSLTTETVLFRFALVHLASETSSRVVMEKLPQKDLHGQSPVVTPCNRQSLNQFEQQS